MAVIFWLLVLVCVIAFVGYKMNWWQPSVNTELGGIGLAVSNDVKSAEKAVMNPTTLAAANAAVSTVTSTATAVVAAAAASPAAPVVESVGSKILTGIETAASDVVGEIKKI
jgi:hypothetical protein